jgi:hypothetical protein
MRKNIIVSLMPIIVKNAIHGMKKNVKIVVAFIVEIGQKNLLIRKKIAIVNYYRMQFECAKLNFA